MQQHEYEVKRVEEVQFSCGDSKLPIFLEVYEILSGEHAGRFVGKVSQFIENTEVFDTHEEVVEQSKERIFGEALINAVREKLGR